MADYGEGHRARCMRIADAVRASIPQRGDEFALAWTDETHVIGRVLVGRRFEYLTVPMAEDGAVVAALIEWCHAVSPRTS